MNRCRRCGLTDKYAFAAMDENGVCKYCRGFRKRVFKGPESLIKDLDLGPSEIVGVTVSGGKLRRIPKRKFLERPGIHTGNRKGKR